MKTKSKKIALLLIISMIVFNYCQSQDTTKHHKKKVRDTCFTSKKNEIRIGAFNLTGHNLTDDLSELYYLDNINDPYDFYPFYFNDDKSYGIGYRCNFKKSAFRLSLNINSNGGSENYPTSSDITKYSYAYSFYQFKLGYEWHIDVSRSEFYYGIDYLLAFNQYSNSYNDVTNSDYYKNTYNSTQTGGSLFLGAKYYFTKMLSLSVETSLDYIYTGSTYNEKVNYQSPSEYPIKTNNYSFRFTPISILSVGVHL